MANGAPQEVSWPARAGCGHGEGDGREGKLPGQSGSAGAQTHGQRSTAPGTRAELRGAGMG